MTSVEPGVLDANVLAYALNADAAQHVAARTLVEAARDPSTTLYVNGVQRIYTFNPGDFQVFAELTVVTPT